jgi:hypothetical protein
MSIAPVNFYSSLSLVPVFAWEPVQDATTDTGPAPATIESGGMDTQPAPAPDADTPAATQMRLVFKGYEWRFTPGIAMFPRPDWMDGITAGCNEDADPSARNDENRKRAEEAARARRAVLQATQQHEASGTEDAGPAATDTSDPR